MIWTIIETAYKLSPFLVIVSTGMVSIGFVRLLFSTTGVVRDLTLGFLTLYAMVLARTFYWDILSVYMPADAWQQWIAITRGITFNLIFNIAVMLASFYSLRAVYLSIPRQERRDYSILTGIFYPRSSPARRMSRRRP